MEAPAPPLVAEDGAHVWTAAEVDLAREGTRILADGEVAEIDRALRHLRSLGDLDLPDIGPDTFPLPTLGPWLAQLGEEIRRGRGFLLLRGIPPGRYSRDDLARIHYGIGSHAGRAVPQSHRGELIANVMNIGDVEKPTRAYTVGGPLGAHTDNCDVIGLMALVPAAKGGISQIISAGAVHNRLLATRPDLLAVLYRGFVHRRPVLDATHGSGVAVRKSATFSRASGSLSSYMTNGYVTNAVEAGDTTLTETERSALRVLSRMLESSDLRLAMPLSRGDIQFLDNRRIFHARTTYRDPWRVRGRRHFLRLWLMMDAWPPLPANQGLHNSADHGPWRSRRTPFMELPSRHIADIERRRAARVRA